MNFQTLNGVPVSDEATDLHKTQQVHSALGQEVKTCGTVRSILRSDTASGGPAIGPVTVDGDAKKDKKRQATRSSCILFCTAPD